LIVLKVVKIREFLQFLKFEKCEFLNYVSYYDCQLSLQFDYLKSCESIFMNF